MSDTELNDVTVKKLSDDELYQKLKELGGPIGPIVKTTRSVYERKLLQLLHGPVGSDTSEHSDEPEETEIDSAPKYYPETKVISPPKFQNFSSSEIKFRKASDFSYKKEGMYFDPTTLARSSYRADLQNAKNKSSIYSGVTTLSNKRESASKSKITKVVFVIFICLVVLICIVIYNMEGNSINPIPEINPPGSV